MAIELQSIHLCMFLSKTQLGMNQTFLQHIISILTGISKPFSRYGSGAHYVISDESVKSRSLQGRRALPLLTDCVQSVVPWEGVGYICFLNLWLTHPFIFLHGRKMGRGNMGAHHLAGTALRRKGGVRSLLENFPETSLKMNLYHCVKK